MKEPGPFVGLYLGAAAHLHAVGRHFGGSGAHPYIEKEDARRHPL